VTGMNRMRSGPPLPHTVLAHCFTFFDLPRSRN
jgi:hypothetical protein